MLVNVVVVVVLSVWQHEPLIGPRRLRAYAPALDVSLFSRARAQIQRFAAAKHRMCGTPIDPDRGEICGGTFWIEEGVRATPGLAIEEAVLALRHSAAVAPLLPSARYVGAEWWVQWRPCEAGMGLHVDADVGLFESERLKDGRFGGPTRAAFISSVTFFGSAGGPTMILDQRFDSGPDGDCAPLCNARAHGLLQSSSYDRSARPDSPAQGEIVFPRENTLVLFNGSLVHGVLPGPACGTTDQLLDAVAQLDATRDEHISVDTDASDTSHTAHEHARGGVEQQPGSHPRKLGPRVGRATLLVNFWLDRAPSQALPVGSKARFFGVAPPAVSGATAVPDVPEGEAGPNLGKGRAVGGMARRAGAPPCAAMRETAASAVDGRLVLDMRHSHGSGAGQAQNHSGSYLVQYHQVEGRDLPRNVVLRVPHTCSAVASGGTRQLCTLIWAGGNDSSWA